MRIWLPALLSLVACSNEGIPNLPVNPGTGGPGGGGHSDASVDGMDGGSLIAGKVCLLLDARDLTTCAGTGAGNLTVAIGASTALTADDGSFMIAPPAGTNLVWSVAGPTIVTSFMPAGTITQIPAIDTTTYGDLQSNNGVLLGTDQGAVMTRLTSSGAPLVGARATAVPAPQFGPFYDGNNAQVWAQSGTGAHGTAWLPGITQGNASLEATPSGGSATAIGSVPVVGQAITYVFADIP